MTLVQVWAPKPSKPLYYVIRVSIPILIFFSGSSYIPMILVKHMGKAYHAEGGGARLANGEPGSCVVQGISPFKQQNHLKGFRIDIQ